jgi:hypothetical protein
MQPETDENLSQKELGFAETVIGIITSPAATVRDVSRGNALRLAVPAFFLALLVTNTTAVLTEPELAQLLGGSGAALVVLTAFSFLYLLSQSGLCYSLARLFGCRGSFATLLSLLALANVPSVFSAPLALLRFVPGLAGGFFHGLGSFALAVWVIALGVLAVRETFQVSGRRAVIIFFLPLFLVLLLVVVLVLAAALT